MSISPVEGNSKETNAKGTDDICGLSTKDAFPPTESWNIVNGRSMDVHLPRSLDVHHRQGSFLRVIGQRRFIDVYRSVFCRVDTTYCRCQIQSGRPNLQLLGCEDRRMPKPSWKRSHRHWAKMQLRRETGTDIGITTWNKGHRY